jgi:hypothetical protein
MNYGELKAAIIKDSHRDDYATEIPRYISQGEGLIASMLDGYILSDVLTDIDRVAPTSSVYVLGSGITTMRSVIRASTGVPLKQTDETTASQHTQIKDPLMYVMRDASIYIVGNPGTGELINIVYYGMPQPLFADADTNSLLNEYPQLYNMAAEVFILQRARNWMAAKEMKADVGTLIRNINRRTRKRLGGAQSATPYNVNFRSSY